MSKCPYTWFKGLFTAKGDGSEASQLRVTVTKNKEMTVDVTLPARSARWLIDLIPDDVMTKIRDEGIPIDDIQTDLAERKMLEPQKVFTLVEPARTVDVWLE